MSERPVIGLCGGSGITPVMSITKHVLATSARPVRLLYANRDAASVIFEDALAGLQAAYPGRLEVRHHHDSDVGLPRPPTMWSGSSAPTSRPTSTSAVPAPSWTWSRPSWRAEGWPPSASSLSASWSNSRRRRTAAEEAGGGGAGADDVPGEVTVILNKKTVVVAYQRGDTLLETARRGGLRPPFSCESGNCATCMAFLQEGSAVMRANNALTPEEVEEGWILTCQGLPRGHTVTVEYEAM